MDSFHPNKKVYDLDEALKKIRDYCAYQDRSQYEVRQKLGSWGIIPLAAEEIIARLIQDKFLDEERFARSFVRGKFRMKKWGRPKIRKALYAKEVPESCIRLGMEEIDENEYLQSLEELARKKASSLRGEKNRWIKANKVKSYLMQRGFEGRLVHDTVQNVLGL